MTETSNADRFTEAQHDENLSFIIAALGSRVTRVEVVVVSTRADMQYERVVAVDLAPPSIGSVE